MTNYRRSGIAGASYFFTVNLAVRSQAPLTGHIALLRNAFEYTRKRHHFTVDAIVILPDHLHAIWPSLRESRHVADGLGGRCRGGDGVWGTAGF
ncbi:MAG: hypothetical protein A2V79_02710 [Betaproteobacteria bacterium RBG_16_56_24]|nr:MAG: hypothetical protein A2V79_02710 [Betaproteobacteria bacterium RBG_16_56_24]